MKKFAIIFLKIIFTKSLLLPTVSSKTVRLGDPRRYTSETRTDRL